MAGLDCPACAADVERAIQQLDGVLDVDMSFATRALRLEFRPDLVTLDRITRTVTDLGYRIEEGPKTAGRAILHVEGMDCAEELRTIEAALRKHPAVGEITANFVSRSLAVTFDPATLDAATVRRMVTRTGFPASLEGESPPERSWLARNGRWLLLALSGAALAPAVVATAGEFFDVWTLPVAWRLGDERLVTVATVLFAVAMAAAGWSIARKAVRSLRHSQFDMNILMTVAALGAAAIWEWAEGASAMFLFALALQLESYTMGRARRAVEELMKLAPATARVRRDGEVIEVPSEEVRPNEVVVVRAGETVPVDGRVASGITEVNQAPVTGESAPVTKGVGDEVFAGSINHHGVIEVRSTKAAGDSTLARILHLVEEAESSRAPTQQFVERFARRYTPAVIFGAVLVATVPPLVFDRAWESWFFRALVLLVIACPCALVISTPVSIISALSSAARRGILIKGGSHLENLGRARTFIFDKTGTLTHGDFTVVSVAGHGGTTEDEVLRVAAAVESHSEHLLGEAIRARAREAGMSVLEGGDGRALPGLGTKATVEGRPSCVGNLRLVESLGLASDAVRQLAASVAEGGRTVVLVTRDERVLGAVALADRPRPEAGAAVAELRALGARDVVMLTGDGEATARAVGEAVGVDHVHAGLLPEDKLEKVQFLVHRDGAAVMIGDGVNDAPALAAATVGVAMGAAGTDAALETADVALMTDRLDRVPEAVRLGRRTERTIRQNIALSLGLKALVFVLAMANLATLWMAVAADMGASLLVIANGLRLLRGPRRRNG